MTKRRGLYRLIDANGDDHGFTSLQERSTFISENPHLFNYYNLEEPQLWESIPDVLISEKAVIAGVGKDEPIVTNERGGSQSRSLYRLDLVDPKAILETARVLAEGAEKYGAENWRLLDINDHLNHLLIHVYAYLAGDRSDGHLSHAVCRALFALGVEKQLEEEQQNVMAR